MTYNNSMTNTKFTPLVTYTLTIDRTADGGHTDGFATHVHVTRTVANLDSGVGTLAEHCDNHHIGYDHDDNHDDPDGATGNLYRAGKTIGSWSILANV